MGFSYEDYLYSAAAVANGLDNTPNAEEEGNIRNTLIPIVDAIFELANEKWPGCMDPTPKVGSLHSGFRSEQVNRIVGGSNTSAHRRGLAADLYPKNGKVRDLMELIISTPRIMRNIDQIILERGCVHVGLSKDEPRHEIREEKYVGVNGNTMRTYPLVRVWTEE